MVEKECDVLFKVLLIGDSGSGKSSLLIRFAENTFSDYYISTIGVNYKIKTIEMNEQIIKLQVWDTAGQETFRNITSSYYRGSNGIIVVYDVTNRSSFDHIPFWLKESDTLAPDVVRIIVGNKTDKNEDRVVSKREIKMLSDQYNIPYIETSALSGRNVDNLFIELTEYMLDAHNTAEPEAMAASSVQLPLVASKQVEKKECC